MMIPFNLKKDEYKNHPMDGKYGVIITNTSYAGYPVTNVDNHREIINNKYTREPALCLLHLSEDVRMYTQLRLYDEFLYHSFSWSKPTYRIFPYEKVELSNEEIVNILKRVFYFHQPALQTHSLVGSSSDRLDDDPNYYEGRYVLNDEEEYTILKCRTTYRFYRGIKRYYPDWKKSDQIPLFEAEIDFEMYALALEVERKRHSIVTRTNEILDNEEDDQIAVYKGLKQKLKEMVQGRI